MFGLIISGRPVDAAAQALTEAQYAFRIQPSPTFSHIVVFVLPGAQLPPDTAASVYIQMPPAQDFRFLGGIGPGKESAIFKVTGVKQGMVPANLDADAMTDDTGAMSNDGGALAGGADIVVGVSIEPAAQVEQQVISLKTGQAQPYAPSNALVRLNSGTDRRMTTKVLAQRIIGNAFNFLASFGSDTIPLKAFEEWWKKFEKKVELDPGFLEREGQG